MHHQRAVKELDGSEKFFSAIGRFIVEFSQIELFLKALIANAIDLKTEYVPSVLAHDFAVLCTIADNVAVPRLTEEQGPRLKKLLNKCRELNAERVRIAHGLWVVGKDFGELHHGPKGKLEVTMHFTEADKIAVQADLARRLRQEFRGFRIDQI